MNNYEVRDEFTPEQRRNRKIAIGAAAVVLTGIVTGAAIAKINETNAQPEHNEHDTTYEVISD